MKTIQLTQGYTATVDDEDYERLNKRSWCVCFSDDRRIKMKAVRGVVHRRADGTKYTRILAMHREILGLQHYDNRIVDHIDGNPLNNCRNNLRLASPLENSRNMKKKPGCSSDLKGAVWDKGRNKWKAEIRANGRRMHLGRFDTAEEAHAAYRAAALKYHGEFANLETINANKDLRDTSSIRND